MHCRICRSTSRPVKYKTPQARICQWCVTFLSEQPVSPAETIEKFNAIIDSYVEKQCQPKAHEYYVYQSKLKLGYQKKYSFIESIFNKKRINKEKEEILNLALKLLEDDKRLLENKRKEMREKAVASALARSDQPKKSTRGYRGWLKIEDLVSPKLVKYMNAINLGILSGTEKATRPSPEEWEDLRKIVLDRDGHRCKVCNERPKERHVHHIIPISNYGSNHLNNLITLCYSCHNKAHPDITVTSYAH